jgi:hypothetical protein
MYGRRGNKAISKVFWQSYLDAGGKHPPSLVELGGGTPSYRAMCFTLLHDQDIMSSIIESTPELWRTPSFEDLQVLSCTGVTHILQQRKHPFFTTAFIFFFNSSFQCVLVQFLHVSFVVFLNLVHLQRNLWGFLDDIA